jgi:hypothetical protein
VRRLLGAIMRETIDEKNNRYILNFRITIPLIYRFWFDSLIDDDKLMIIYSTDMIEVVQLKASQNLKN